MTDHTGFIARVIVDATAVVGVAASLLQYAPPFAALIAAGYYGVLLWDSRVGRRWRKGWGLLFRRLIRQNLGPRDPEEVMVYWFIAFAGLGFAAAMLAVQFSIEAVIR